ncbi:MAG: helix-turn-helix transcriptional regulator [Microthrixaceae bacterium]
MTYRGADRQDVGADVVKESSGIPTFDTLIEGGLEIGDNVVWLADRSAMTAPMVEAFTAVPGNGLRRHVCLSDPEGCAHPDGLEVVHAMSGAGKLEESHLEELLADPAIGEGDRVVVAGLDDLMNAWGAEATLAFYRRTCPRLFDRGALALWVGGLDLVGPGVVSGIARIAQCVFELRGDRLRVLKAEGRSRRLQGVVASFGLEDGVPTVSREHTVGRLGEGLRRIRVERGLTQAQLSDIASVTPAAISQAETGRRGLSLDTLVPMCESLGIGLDDLLGTGRPAGPFLARHDRQGGSGGTSSMFDDPQPGPRVQLVELGAGQSSAPLSSSTGSELLLVAHGLVLVDLGDSTPVLRAGDGLVNDRAVLGWTNLQPSPARFFRVSVE